MTLVDISGLNTATVFAALYNHAKPFGYGFLHFDPTPMTPATALPYVTGVQNDDIGHQPRDNSHYFDYVKGRAMKVRFNFNDHTIHIDGFDEFYGYGTAQSIVDVLRWLDNDEAVG